jgi:hypothetical protein
MLVEETYKGAQGNKKREKIIKREKKRGFASQVR